MKLSLIIPCYNEEDVLQLFYTEIKNVLAEYHECYELIFVDDGSKDKTFNILLGLASRDENVKYISFSRNFGKEAAMLAGMKLSSGEYVGILDADLQHPPKAIIKMIEALEDGYDMAAARRVNRNGEDKIKSYFSRKFYVLINNMIDVKIEDGAQDFRVMKRKVVESIISLPEYHRFSKGIFSWVGFKTKWFEHENVERPVGVSKWSFNKLLRYAIDGIIAFSTIPLKISLIFGSLVSSIGFLYGFYIIIKTLFVGVDTPGYASLMAGILFFSGIILTCIGILGEYISRIYIEVKNRPIFIINETNIEKKLNSKGDY
ncbi:glycosyltransferase family 2 protein [Clostridium sp. CMCC3677]|uniref:glycosyltransferase family 2 protein n=1 Tax=Clostridium sp. CMCC3677 TaxID=2949963 RepID=UPI0013F0A663|nr:glycosyltransferase family 2 protein [Clostridium sp. CMCC3677]NFG60732.1 glycosyltransferase family 2 protein [Clostridium botulinum]NFQ08166.1 glycosyltransferase family 2 protein [Clostridium botulinum]